MPPPQQPYPNGPQQPPNPYGPPPQANPGPYGQQSPQAATGPYGQQPPQAAPGPYGSPYPQQQPYPPQQPYAQQPYPGWGAPPMAPLPKKRRVGLILGIVGGAVVAVVVALALIGMAVESGFPEAKNKLTLPQTLLDGKYRLAKDLSATEGKKIEDEADGAWDAKDTHGVVGTYALGGDATKGNVVVSGMYGRFKNADLVRREAMKGFAQGGSNPELAVAPKEFHLQMTISCEVVTQEQTDTKITIPACVWADGNTSATVAFVDRPLASQNPSDVDLAALARQTVQIRSEAVAPI